jgi:hypothetical protein
MLNANFLFASLIWSAVGVAFLVYGKKQSSWVPLAGGLLMIVVSYCIGSALVMSVICLGITAVVYMLLKNGW